MRYLLAASSIGAWASRNYQRTKAEDLARMEIAVVELSYDEWLAVVNALAACANPDLQEADGVIALLEALDQQGLPVEFP
jgi:hypothetical protein